jgi:hypothetical protein
MKKKRNRIRIYSQIFFLIIFNNKLFSNSSLDILKNDVSAGVLGISGAYAVTNADIFSTNYNPATLGLLDRMQIGGNYSNGFEDAKYSYIAYGMPLPFKAISNISNPYMAISIYASNLGDFTYRQLSSDGIVSEKSMDAEKDTVITLAYGEKVDSQTVYISPSVKSKFESSIGVAVKFINSKLLDKYSANTIALDAGYYGSFTDLGLDFGASISNMLGSIKYISEKEDLPSTLRVGLSYSKPTIMDQRFKVAAEFNRYISDKDNSLSAGIEYTLENIFIFRSGYRFLSDNKGFSAGVGLFAGDFTIDVATVFYDVYKYSSVSIKYSFGKSYQSDKNEKKELKKFIKTKEEEKSRPVPPSKTTKDQIIIF